MSIFSGKSGKGAMRDHRATKRREAEARQKLANGCVMASEVAAKPHNCRGQHTTPEQAKENLKQARKDTDLLLLALPLAD